MESWWVCLAIMLVAVPCGIVGVYLIIETCRKSIVEENSVYLKKVLELNRRTEYHTKLGVNGCIKYTMTVNSKAKYDRVSCLDALEMFFLNHRNM